jgi:hypothetical protein
MIPPMWWGLIGFVIGLVIVMVLIGVIMEQGGSSREHH